LLGIAFARQRPKPRAGSAAEQNWGNHMQAPLLLAVGVEFCYSVSRLKLQWFMRRPRDWVAPINTYKTTCRYDGQSGLYSCEYTARVAFLLEVHLYCGGLSCFIDLRI
jgi:hypothetical protein